MKPAIPFGSRVIITSTLEKVQQYHHGRTETNYESRALFVPLHGIYIGYRTAQTGYTRYDEDGPQFKPTGKIRYFLVVTSERKNPVKVAVLTPE